MSTQQDNCEEMKKKQFPNQFDIKIKTAMFTSIFLHSYPQR